MDTERQEGLQADGYGDESLNTSSASDNQESGQQHKKGGIHNNALYAASLGRSATAQVNPHSTSDLANTGTNISYEGPTAPGAGGSAGTGYTSGQADTGATIATDSDYDQAAIGKRNDKAEGDNNTEESENENNSNAELL